MRDERRGVSVPLGVVMLFAIVLAGMVVVIAVGATAMDDTRDRMDFERAEKLLTQFDSKSAVVALGETDSQSVSLAGSDDSGFYVREDVGWMKLTVTDASGDAETIVNVTDLGAVTYENGDRAIAYQGGGVWKQTEAGETMVSPPEFHYRSATLTLPIVTLDGDASLGSRATVTKPDPTSIRYPNATENPDFVNPLLSGTVNVTVHSDYYRAWGVYFGERTDGNVTFDDANETARIELVVPFEEEFDNVVATTDPGGLTNIPDRNLPEPSESGIPYPLADGRIESAIEECGTNDSACTDYSPDDTISDDGTYFVTSHFTGSLIVDDPGGDVTVVVDENFSPSDVDIASAYNTTVLVRDSFDMGSKNLLNQGGEAGDFTVALHSDGAVNGNGNYKFVGLLYAPGSDCTLNGGGSTTPNVVGGAVCEQITINGNPHDFEYDATIEDETLALGDDSTKITFLHVTENPVTVSSE